MTVRVLLLAIVLAGCSKEAAPAADAGTQRPPANQATTGTVTIAIRGMQFVPAAVEVPAGSTVEWKNEDVVQHTATAADNSFDSGRIDAGKSWSYVASKAGGVPYGCTLHPTMKGTLTVK